MIKRVDPLKYGPAYVPVFMYSQGITVLNICDVYNIMYGNSWENHPEYDSKCLDLKAYLIKYDVSYYACPSEQFFLHEGINLAIEEGNKFVIVEDMS